MDKGNTVTRSSPMRRRKSDNKPNENKNSSCRTGPKSMKRNQVSEMRATRVASPRQRVGSNHSSIHHMVLPESVMETAKLLGVKSPPTTPKALAAIAKSSNAANGQKHTAPPQCLQNASVVAWRKTVGVLILLFIIAHSIQSIVYLSERAVDAFDLTLVSHTEALTVVWCSGWLTAATTGLGALPFLFVSDLSDWWLAVSNAFAAGMMLAAAAGLLAEGSTTDPLAATDEGLSPVSRLCIGFITGVLFIYASKLLLDEYEDVKVLDLDSLTTKKVLLIVSVMTLHSFSEGVGIGVSYNSQSLGTFITATLAIHNIPEGLAVAIVLVPRGVSVLYTTIWCVATSLPQPFMAVPAFMFVEEFSFILPIGLGFAAGAMGFVAVFELFMEAQEVLGTKSAGAIGAVALVLMAGAQMSLHS